MILQRLIFAVGAMACAYILSRLSLVALEKLEQSGKFKFLVMILAAVHWFSTIASLFFGWFMYYQKEHTDNLQQRIEELTALQHDSLERCETLENENKQLRNQLGHEQTRTDECSFNNGFQSGYCNGYAVGFEDCMDVLDIPQERKDTFLWMARKSGIHRYKSRPSIFDKTKAIESNGILR